MKQIEVIRIEKSIEKSIDKLFNHDYFILISLDDDICKIPWYWFKSIWYKIEMEIWIKNNYWMEYFLIYRKYSDDIKKLKNDLKKYCKQAIKDWFFYEDLEWKHECLPKRLVNFNELEKVKYKYNY